MQSARKQIVRIENGQAAQAFDDLSVEEPLEIRVDNAQVSVTMRTPGHDEELAVGFLVTEGLLKDHSDIHRIEPHPRNDFKNVINVFLSPHTSIDLSKIKRNLFMSSSCGLCGKASIDSVHQHFPPVEGSGKIPRSVIDSLPAKLNAVQDTFFKTGGLHAAAIFDHEGNLVVAREDVGRHNAVDKVIGRSFLTKWTPLDRHILMVSGRASFEIMQKALAARIPVVCAVSAPSSLAVEFAMESGQTLIGFLRENRMNIYAHPERILL